MDTMPWTQSPLALKLFILIDLYFKDENENEKEKIKRMNPL